MRTTFVRAALLCMTIAGIALPVSAHAATLSKATADWPIPARAAAADVGNGVVVISSTEAAGKAHWDAVAINRASLYGKDAPGGGRTNYYGALAAAGPTIDRLNSAPCRSVPGGSVCVTVLDGDAQAETGEFSSAEGSLATVAASLAGQGGGVALFPAMSAGDSDCARSQSAVARFAVTALGVARRGVIDASSAQDCG